MRTTPSVLLFDPIDDEAEMYAEYLRATGFIVRVVRDCADALETVVAASPDAVVIRFDQRDPSMSGVAALARLKQHAAPRAVPIVTISTSILAQDRETAAAAGSDAYLLLPLEPDRLAAEIRRLLRSYRPGRRRN